MKVVLLAPSLERAGMERQLVELAKGLHGRGLAVRVIVFYGGGGFSAELDAARVPWRSLEKSKRWEVLGFLWRLASAIRAERPDLVYSFLVEPNVIAAILKPLLRRGRLIWGVRVSNLDLDHYDLFARVVFRLSIWLSRQADLVIANSHAGRDHHARVGYPAERMIVIHNGIDVHTFSPVPDRAERFRADWGVGEAPVIGLVARLHPMKDHANFLRAAALVKRRDARFVCIGRGPAEYQGELRSLVESLGLEDRLVWAGEIRDMPAAFSALDVLCVSSSDGEGFPNVVGEAMSCGVPCVVTDVGDSARVIGRTGIVVPPKQPNSLAEAIDRVLTRLDEAPVSVREETRARIVEEFSLGRMIDRTLAAMTSLT